MLLLHSIDHILVLSFCYPLYESLRFNNSEQQAREHDKTVFLAAKRFWNNSILVNSISASIQEKLKMDLTS